VPVRVATIRVGEVSGVFLDEPAPRAIGLEEPGAAGSGGARRYERLGARATRDPAALAGLDAAPDGRLGGGSSVSTRPLTGTRER
jgi:hypothetical protein